MSVIIPTTRIVETGNVFLFQRKLGCMSNSYRVSIRVESIITGGATESRGYSLQDGLELRQRGERLLKVRVVKLLSSMIEAYTDLKGPTKTLHLPTNSHIRCAF